MLFRMRRGQRRPADSGAPLTVSVLDAAPVSPLAAPAPGHRVGNRRLPDIVMPSTAARLAGESPVPKRVVTLYSTILGDRDDAPLFVGIDGRAAVLLRLTGKQRPDLNHLDEALHDDGVQLYLEGHRLDRYGMLRVVLRLPDTDPGLFEAALSLSHGDIQEFVAGAYAHESVVLHVFHATDDRALSSTCTGPGLHRLIREAVDAILDADHPATVAEQQEPVAELAGRFRQPADGLSDETMVRLQATRPAQPFVLFASR